MTYNMFCSNGGYVCCNTVRAWTPLNEANARVFAERASLMTQLTDSIGHADPEDFPYKDLTSEFEYYTDGVEDGFEGNPSKITEVPVPVLELGETILLCS